jgi:hypothetical protein
MKIDF